MSGQLKNAIAKTNMAQIKVESSEGLCEARFLLWREGRSLGVVASVGLQVVGESGRGGVG